MKIDNVEQDVDQTSNCDDLNLAISGSNLGCENFASVSLVALSATDGKITVPEGEQTANQLNDCYDDTSCKNEATLFAGLGQSFFTGADPIDGTLTADYSQSVDQTNLCEGDSACENEALVVYQAFANDDATVNSKSDQTVTQINECGENYNQACLNSALLINHVYAEDTATVDSTVSQNLYQKCDSNDGPTCMNSNTLAVSGSAIDNSFLKYVASQSVTNNDGANDGTTSLTYQTDSNPSTPQPSSLTSNYNQPPNTAVTNPPSNNPYP